jgi:hypothetical protein
MPRLDQQVYLQTFLGEFGQATGHISGKARAGHIAISPGGALDAGHTLPGSRAVAGHEATGDMVAKVQNITHKPTRCKPCASAARSTALIVNAVKWQGGLSICPTHKKNAALFSAAEVRAWFLRESGQRVGTSLFININGKQILNRHDFLFTMVSCRVRFVRLGRRHEAYSSPS